VVSSLSLFRKRHLEQTAIDKSELDTSRDEARLIICAVQNRIANLMGTDYLLFMTSFEPGLLESRSRPWETTRRASTYHTAAQWPEFKALLVCVPRDTLLSRIFPTIEDLSSSDGCVLSSGGQ